MRNRYYDPASGRFTQEDPIGLEGGLNLYGFANGDPVNFSDPFGLKVCFSGRKVQQLADSTQAATGTTLALDQGNCATNVQAVAGRDSSVANSFIGLATDPSFTFDIRYGSQSGLVGLQITINPLDVGTRIYGT